MDMADSNSVARKAAVKNLLQNGFDLSIASVNKGEALLWACEKGLVEESKILLAVHADLAAADEEGRTPLHHAAWESQSEIVSMLLAAGADVAARNDRGNTPLHMAAISGDCASILLLIEHGSDVTWTNNEQITAWILAARWDNCDAMRLLYNAGSDITQVDEDTYSALHWTAYKGALNALQILIDEKLPIPLRRKNGQTPLHSAVLGGSYKALELLLNLGKTKTIAGHELDIDWADEDGDTSLHTAARHGNVDHIEFLLTNGADIHFPNRRGDTPLHTAATSGQQGALRLFLDKGANIEARCNRGYSPLANAAQGGNHETFGLLVERGADITTMTDSGQTLLHLAASFGRTILVQLLVPLIEVDKVTTEGGKSALHEAAEDGKTDTVRLLLDAGADITKVTESGWNPLHLAAEGDHFSTLELLLRRGADPTAKVPEGFNALTIAQEHNASDEVKELLDRAIAHWTNTQTYRNTTQLLLSAAQSGKPKQLEEILKNGAELEAADEDGRTALLVATEAGKEDAVRYLLERGADVNTLNKEGESPLWLAASHGHEGLVSILLNAGATVDTADRSGQTALSAAVQGGYTTLVNVLLQRGAKVDLPTEYGKTPLSFAAQYGRSAIASLLIEKGANVNHTCQDGKTPLSLSTQHNFQETSLLLIKNGAVDHFPRQLVHHEIAREESIVKAAALGMTAAITRLLRNGLHANCRDGAGRTALSSAAERCHNGILSILLRHGADVNLRDGSGATALWWAARSGHQETARQLIESGAEVDVPDSTQRTPLSIACEFGHLTLVTLLVDHGARKELRDKSGNTAVMYATMTGHENIVEHLISEGANIECSNYKGRSPLYAAAQRGLTDIARLLLRSGATMKAESVHNMSPLCITASRGFDALMELLLENGANINYQSDKRWTPLFYASIAGHEMAVKILIESGADSSCKDDTGRTALSLAKEHNKVAVVSLLRRANSLRGLKTDASTTLLKQDVDTKLPKKLFKYPPLSWGKSIRLVELHPGRENDSVSFNLHEADLEDRPSYQSLSYEWKDKIGVIPVLCNEQRLLITPNLRAALQKIRRQDKTCMLWVDALCINQFDIEERNKQVAFMTDIYRQAETVHMWLGEEGPYTKAAFESMPKLLAAWDAHPEYSKKDLSEVEGDLRVPRSDIRRFIELELGEDTLDTASIDKLDAVKGARDLVERHYFNRAWVFQEIMLAGPRGVIVCGAQRCPWDVFKRYMVFWTAWWYSDRITDHLHNILYDIRKFEQNGGIKLEGAMQTMAHLSCSDPRDKVFAALGVLKSSSIKADYNLTVQQTFVKAARSLVWNVKDLCFWGFYTRPKSKHITGLPSWVPDWTYGDHTDAKPFVPGTWVDTDRLFEGDLVVTNLTTLWVDGYRMDKVASIVPINTGDDVYDKIVRPIVQALASLGRSIFNASPASKDLSNLALLSQSIFQTDITDTALEFLAWKISTDASTPDVSKSAPASMATDMEFWKTRSTQVSDFDHDMCSTMETSIFVKKRGRCELVVTAKGYLGITNKGSAEEGMAVVLLGGAGRIALLKELRDEHDRWHEFVDFVKLCEVEWQEAQTMDEFPIAGCKERFQIR